MTNDSKATDRPTGAGATEKCFICKKDFDPENGFTWLVNGKPANVRFDKAVCMAVYYSDAEPPFEEIANELETSA